MVAAVAAAGATVRERTRSGGTPCSPDSCRCAAPETYRFQVHARSDRIRTILICGVVQQAHSLGNGPLRRADSSGAGDAWTETLNAVSSTLEENMRSAVTYASVFSGWASSLIANLDPTTLLFEDDEDYDYSGRC